MNVIVPKNRRFEPYMRTFIVGVKRPFSTGDNSFVINTLFTSSTCIAVASPEGATKAEHRFGKLELSNEFSALDSTRNVTIPIVHVSSEDDTLVGGNTPDEQIIAQIDVPNADYTPNRIKQSGRLPGSVLVLPIRQPSSHIYPSLMLNIKFTSDGTELPGYFIFPDGHADASKLDRITILYSFVVGCTSAPYNLERTLTHKAGRWPGLHHTFQSGCTGDGNSIADILPEASPAYGRSIGRDTYTDDNLPDP
ncbi:hypothetical protein BDM02DRAFT_3193918 [Thelephora ganbajun]|uniref:Uncharacterized protein n=1 Tax=Thelephora ganbajun TaxID=370292 RepID=A0ACB6YXG7_THEGA|nr:hypothetical protein BDM02DRAFT_3193918 [Thelephora ganbajun]